MPSDGVTVFGWLLTGWIALGCVLLHRKPCSREQGLASAATCGSTLPLSFLAFYDVTLALLGVLVRAWSRSSTVGANLPFLHSCSRRSGSIRVFLSWLSLVQAVHLHICARLESPALRMLSAALTTLPWWMDRRGGWTVVLRGRSSLGDVINELTPRVSIVTALVSHVPHLHGLFFGLNLTVALSHFREESTAHRIVDLQHFRSYWLWLHAATGCDVFLQALVDRRRITPRFLHWLSALSVVPVFICAIPVLKEHVSVEGATFSVLLWYLRPDHALSNFTICMLWTEIFEVVSLLVERYNLVA